MPESPPASSAPPTDTVPSRTVWARDLPWLDWFPWLVLFRVPRISLKLPALLLALVGLWATSAGWSLLGRQLLTDVDRVRGSWQGDEYTRLTSSPRAAIDDFTSESESASALVQIAHSNPLYIVYGRFLAPFQELFSARTVESARPFLFFSLGGLWSVAVWGIVGLGISRMAIGLLGPEQQVSLVPAVRYGWSHARHAWLAPLIPLFGIGLLTIPLIVIGWCMRLNVGVVLAAILWLPVLGLSLVMGIVLFGLTFGWPLMVPAIAAEGKDSFDAISRSYAYALQRPFHYAGYTVLASGIGILAWIVVTGFTDGIDEISRWGTMWGAGAARIQQIHVAGEPNGSPLHALDPSARPNVDSPTLRIGSRLMVLASRGVRSLSGAFAYSYFWCAASAIYLLLRRDTDQLDTDVWYEERPEESLRPPSATVPPPHLNDLDANQLREPAAASAKATR